MIRAVIMMKFWKKTFPFILLNIVVSAATLLAVLYFWQQKSPLPNTEPTQPIITPIQGKQSPSLTTPTAQILEDRLLRIEGVFGAGDIKVNIFCCVTQARPPWILLAGRLFLMAVAIIAFPI